MEVTRRKVRSRRSFVRTLTGGAGMLLLKMAGESRNPLGSIHAAVESSSDPSSGWDQVPAILSRIKPPKFPTRDFDVRRFGAVADGGADSHQAFKAAIHACTRGGGGRVTVPAGVFLTNGPIHLKSNVNLHLDAGATIKFGTNPEKYLPAVLVRWEGTRCYNYSPLIYAFRQQNIAVTGPGVIDGQAALFWGAWKSLQQRDQETLRKMGTEQAPVKRRVFGRDHFLRPDLFQAYECRNLLLEGVTIKGSPFWSIHPVFCTNMTVRHLRVDEGTTNDDGINPESCRDVLIECCTFSTRDDNIAIKAGRDRDAWGSMACENIIVRGCSLLGSEANGLCIGSEMSGDVRNVFFEANRIFQVGNALCIKSNTDRGGIVENVWMRDISVETCNTCLMFETDYKGIDGHPYPATYRNFHVERVTCRTARKMGLYSVGIAQQPISNIFLKDIAIEKAATAKLIRHTKALRLENVSINGQIAGVGNLFWPARKIY